MFRFIRDDHKVLSLEELDHRIGTLEHVVSRIVSLAGYNIVTSLSVNDSKWTEKKHPDQNNQDLW